MCHDKGERQFGGFMVDYSNLSLFDMMQKRMAYLSEKQAVIANNIANSDTPKYIPKTLEEQDFSAQLGKSISMKRTNAKHLDAGALKPQYDVVDQRNVQLKPNGNGVNTEQEAYKMMRNQGEYTTTTNLYRRTMSMMRHAINGPQGQ